MIAHYIQAQRAGRHSVPAATYALLGYTKPADFGDICAGCCLRDASALCRFHPPRWGIWQRKTLYDPALEPLAKVPARPRSPRRTPPDFLEDLKAKMRNAPKAVMMFAPGLARGCPSI